MSAAEACFAYADWIQTLPEHERANLISAMEAERAENQAFADALDALMETVPPVARYGDGHAGGCLALIWQAFEPYREAQAPPARRTRKDAIPQRLRTTVFERDEYRCVRCGSHKGLQCDHIHPESKGGPTAEWNLQTLCRSCNASKGAKVE